MGFAQRRRSPDTLVVSYTTVSPLPGRNRAVCSLFALARGLPRVGVTHHPCSVEPGRSSAVAGRDRLVTCPQATHSTCSTQSRVIRSRKSGPLRRPNVTKLIHMPDRPCRFVLIRWMGEDPVAALRGQRRLLRTVPLSTSTAYRHRSCAVSAKRVLAALKKVSKRSDALERLGVGASLAEDVERNTVLDTIACAPALLTYSGVLYEAMGASALVAAADDDEVLRERLHDVLVFSALFGRVHGLDVIPAYRLAMKTELADLGRLTSFWKPILAESSPLSPAEVALDCRSSDYRSAWPGPNDRVVTMGGRHGQGRQAPRRLPLGEVLPWAVRRPAARRRTSAAGEHRRAGGSGPGVLRCRVHPAHRLEAGGPDDRARGLKGAQSRRSSTASHSSHS
jgi:hypothetical protein